MRHLTHERPDGTHTARWQAIDTECGQCQPTIPGLEPPPETPAREAVVRCELCGGQYRALWIDGKRPTGTCYRCKTQGPPAKTTPAETTSTAVTGWTKPYLILTHRPRWHPAMVDARLEQLPDAGGRPSQEHK